MKNDRSSKIQDNRGELVGDLVRIKLRGSTWYANFQYNGKQHRPTLKTRSKKEARRKAIKLEAKILDGEYMGQAKAPTIEKVATAYLKHLRTENKAQKTLKKCELVKRRLLDLAVRRKARSILDIDLAFIDAYRAEAAARTPKPAGAKTMLNETVVIRQIINFALSRKMIQTDPLAGLKAEEGQASTAAMLESQPSR